MARVCMMAAASAFLRSVTGMCSSSSPKRASPTVSLTLSQLPGSSGMSRLALAMASEVWWRMLAASLA
ncbi:hypothetical protein BU198_30505 [Streptomyces sp. CBMA156]|nr:hypothetical protein [Streptomyces sp. CBMA156]MBD0674917.1 hypothetical protein [Streptomyces sp. CBMA156]